GVLECRSRWGAWIFSMAVVLTCRLELNLFVLDAERPETSAVGARLGRFTQAVPDLGKWMLRVFFVFALVLPFVAMYFFPARDRQFIDIAILIMTYVMLGWGLNIVVGLAGLLDLGYVAFYAVGAYSFALLSTHFEFIGFWTALPLAGLLAAMWG